MTDPVVILRGAADLCQPGGRGAVTLNTMADRIAAGGMVYPVRMRLEEIAELRSLYTEDERAAFALAVEELKR